MKNNNLIVGSEGSGKSKFIYQNLHDDIKKGESLFILTNKLNNIDEIKDDLIKNNYDLKVINLSDLDNSCEFNILKLPYEYYKAGKIDDALNILDVISDLIYKVQENSDPYWVNSAASIFKSVVLSLFETEKFENINLKSVMSILSSEGNGSFTLKEYFSRFSEASVIYDMGSPIFNAPNETRASIISVAKQKLGIISCRENLSKIISNSSFDINLDKSEAIVLVTNNINESLKIISTAILYEIFYCLYKNDHNVFNFIIEDIALIDSLPIFKNIFAESKENNIYFKIPVRTTDYFDDLFDNSSIYFENINIESKIESKN